MVLPIGQAALDTRDTGGINQRFDLYSTPHWHQAHLGIANGYKTRRFKGVDQRHGRIALALGIHGRRRLIVLVTSHYFIADTKHLLDIDHAAVPRVRPIPIAFDTVF